MRYIGAIFFLTTLFLLSCKSSKIEKMSSQGASLTEEETVLLSKDCDYVRKHIKRGLKRWKEPKVKKISDRARRKEYYRTMTIKHGHRWAKENKRRKRVRPKQKLKVKKYKKSEREIPFQKNDLLVSLLEHTSCLNGNTKEQIKNFFGEPNSTRGSSISPNDYMIYHFHYEKNKYHTVSFVFEDDLLLSTHKSWMEKISTVCFPQW